MRRRKGDRPHPRLIDLLAEAGASLLARPARTAMMSVGTTLGVLGVVATLALGTTARQQISARFDALRATEVRVTAAGDNDPSAYGADPAGSLEAVSGVVASGLVGYGPSVELRLSEAADRPVLAQVVGMDPAALTALRTPLVQGVALDPFHASTRAPVALLGSSVAQRLGLVWSSPPPAVLVGSSHFTVLGVTEAGPTDPRAANWLIVPLPTLEAMGVMEDVELVIQTAAGAGRVVADLVPIALRPDAPAALSATAPPDPRDLREEVEEDTQFLLLGVAAIALLVGIIGIGTTTLLAVVERVPEFGLRRAVGYLPRHIALTVLSETALVGTIGGYVGALLGVVTVVVAALVKNWTPVVEPLLPAAATGLGTLAGVVAGLIPARAASRIEPADALRR